MESKTSQLDKDSSNKQEEAIITNEKEFNDIQNELVEKSKGKFIKPPLQKDAEFSKVPMSRNLAISLLFTYKHFKFGDNKLTDYFPKKTLTQYLKDYPNITRNFNHLVYWDLIAPMPTNPNEVIYKKGWYGITENGIAFIQQEIGLPKYAFVHNNFAYEHQTNPYVMITDLIEKDELKALLKT